MIDWKGEQYDFSRRLNNRWYFLCVLAHNSRYGGKTSIDQLREIRRFQSRKLGHQIANWFNDDQRVGALARCESPTKGPYSLKDNVVEVFDGESAFRELGLDVEPVRLQWRKTRQYLDAYVQATALFQQGHIRRAIKKCSDLISRGVAWSIRFECGLLLARCYTALGFFEDAEKALVYCKSEQVPREFQARVTITQARIEYFGEQYDHARRTLDAPSLRSLPWFSQADWYELSALLEAREFKRLSNQAYTAVSGRPLAEKRRLLHEAMRSYEQGEKYLDRALSLRLLHADPHGVQATCFNLGNLIWKRTPAEGRAWIQMSETICGRWGVGQDTILPQFVIASMDLHDGRREEAWSRAQQAFTAAHDRDNVFDRATAHRQHARYYLSTREPPEDVRLGLAHVWVCYRIYTILNLQDSLAALERDFPGRVSDAGQVFGAKVKAACSACATLPVLVARGG